VLQCVGTARFPVRASYEHTHKYIHTYVYIYIYIYICASIYVYIYIHMYVCVYTYIYVHGGYSETPTRTHTQIYSLSTSIGGEGSHSWVRSGYVFVLQVEVGVAVESVGEGAGGVGGE